LQIALSFFIIIGEGNSTQGKLTLCSLIIAIIVIILLLYLLEAVSQLVFYVNAKVKEVDLREGWGWAMNATADDEESHHSESINGSMKDKQEKLEEVNPAIQSQNLETLLVQIKEEMKEKI
jgi:hypothetical protein